MYLFWVIRATPTLASRTAKWRMLMWLHGIYMGLECSHILTYSLCICHEEPSGYMSMQTLGKMSAVGPSLGTQVLAGVAAMFAVILSMT